MKEAGYFMDIRSISQPFGIIYVHFGIFLVVGYIFLRLGMLSQEKSGNPVAHHSHTE
jgi:hypothetical protein